MPIPSLPPRPEVRYVIRDFQGVITDTTTSPDFRSILERARIRHPNGGYICRRRDDGSEVVTALGSSFPSGYPLHAPD